MKNYKNYDDTEARQLALKLLNEKHIFDHAINPKLADQKALCDIECDNCYIDVKERKNMKYDDKNLHTYGMKINRDSYLKYNEVEKDVYIMYLLQDACIIFNAKTPIEDKDKWFGLVEDRVFGKIYKHLWNWPLSKKLIEYKYEQEQED